MKQKTIIVPSRQFSELVCIKEIVLCKADGSYTHVVVKDKRTIVSSKKLSWFENKIKSDQFFRVHKSYFINIEFINKIYRSEDKVCLSTGIIIPLSRYRKKSFLQKLEGLGQ